MRLLVGLGNPGSKYQHHRHNIGFMALDEIAQRHNFPNFRNRFNGLWSEGTLGFTKCALLKPQTYMNESGQAVGEAIRYLKIALDDVVVFHDELDLAPGKLRCKQGGGHAGHNGLRSIDAHCGAGYYRVRLGIGHPGVKELVHSHVLSDFSGEEKLWLKPLLQAIAEAANLLAESPLDKFQTKTALLQQQATPSSNVKDR